MHMKTYEKQERTEYEKETISFSYKIRDDVSDFVRKAT